MLARSTEPTCLVAGWSGEAHWSASPAIFCRGQDKKLWQMQSEKHSVHAGLPSCYQVPVTSVRTFLQSREYIASSPHSVFPSCWDSCQGGLVFWCVYPDRPGLSLTKCSLHFCSCCLLFDFSCLSLSKEASHPLCLSYTLVLSYSKMHGCSFSTQGIWTNSLSQIAFKEPPSLRLPESPWGLSAEWGSPLLMFLPYCDCLGARNLVPPTFVA